MCHCHHTSAAILAAAAPVAAVAAVVATSATSGTSGVLNQAAAVRQLSEAATEPADLKQLLPHKDANGVWQPANTTGVDFDTLTLENLPAPEVFLEIAMTSPYPMPQIPMALLVNNTVNQWAGGKPPASVQDWLLLVQGAGNYVSSTLPNFLVKLLPNITLPDGQKLSIGEEAGKILTSALNGTLELPVPEEMAAAAGLNKPDSMDLIKGINVTLEVVKKLPALLKQVAQNMAQGVNSLGMPNVDLFNDDGTLDVAGLLKSVLNIEISTPTLPPAPDASQILAGERGALAGPHRANARQASTGRTLQHTGLAGCSSYRYLRSFVQYQQQQQLSGKITDAVQYMQSTGQETSCDALQNISITHLTSHSGHLAAYTTKLPHKACDACTQ